MVMMRDPEFPLSATSLATLEGALMDGFGEYGVACDMPEPCGFLSLENCQKRILWTHKEADRAPNPIVGLVLHVGDAEKFPEAPGEKKCQGSYPLSATVTIG